MQAALQFIATLSAGLFAGAATYITFVEHPARMQCGTRPGRNRVRLQLQEGGDDASRAV